MSLPESSAADTDLDMLARTLATDPDVQGYVHNKDSRHGLLSHIVPRRGHRAAPVSARPTRRKYSRDQLVPKYFPPKRLIPLLQEAESVRDQVLYFLGCFGALRLSEALNLYSVDITLAEYQPTVRLAHPELAMHQWRDSFGRKRSGTRLEYLRDAYGLLPRSLLPPTDRLYAGWKGMVYHGPEVDTQEGPLGRYMTTIFWLFPQAQTAFWRLHEAYEPLRIALAGHHPYYFVNLRGPHAGEPLSAKNAQAAFTRAAKRAGSPVTNAHSTRHFYGHVAANLLRKRGADGKLLPLSLEEVRAMMRHRNIESTRVYSVPDITRLRNELAEAGIPTGPTDFALIDKKVSSWLDGIQVR